MCSSFKEEDEHSKLSTEILNFLGMFEELFFPFLIYSMFFFVLSLYPQGVHYRHQRSENSPFTTQKSLANVL